MYSIEPILKSTGTGREVYEYRVYFEVSEMNFCGLVYKYADGIMEAHILLNNDNIECCCLGYDSTTCDEFSLLDYSELIYQTRYLAEQIVANHWEFKGLDCSHEDVVELANQILMAFKMALYK